MGPRLKTAAALKYTQMKNVLALVLMVCVSSAASAAQLLAFAKIPRREKPKATAAQAPAASLPALPAEDPYNMFHMMAEPAPSKPAPLPKRLPYVRPLLPLRK